MKILILITIFLALPLMAQEKPRTIDFTQPLIGVDGKVIPASTTDPTPVTLGQIVHLALNSKVEGDDPDKGFERGALAARLYTCKACELGKEDGALVIKHIKAVFGADVQYATFPLLDPVTYKKVTP
jgi:hypothetical protein